MSLRSVRRFQPLLATRLSLSRPASTFRPSPAPPKLPADEQAEFERLQRDASVSAAFQPQEPTTAQSSSSSSATKSKGEDDTVNQGLFRGAKPEFEGDVNPKTGEVGGPKNDPLRWKGDWSYNGRVTDF
ncbi:hypothetical protein NLU13_8377 [Sarocladium strictum]|uniref:Succinate dehydrogenase assembly factor 4, mitochondrial n=1 Tax=Sarocladium strictum TaxID=5046 RepID=A0AA39L553_SARSR|nr:hypothetical protein NLU13_8377 [Sarocladium strictum]